MSTKHSQTLNIYTVNANGLNSPWKRKALLQEAKVRGTAILIANAVEFQMESTKLDPQRNYTFVKGKIQSQQFTFASIYLPNNEQHKTMERICTQLLDFTEGTLIIGGDLNTPLDPHIDCSSGKASLPYKRIKQIKSQLQLAHVIDTRRIANPTTKDFTHFSHSHNTYNRIDYIFLSHNFLDNMKEATTENISWTDHSPVILRLEIPNPYPKKYSWKINDSLLKIPEILENIISSTKEFFKVNVNTASTPILEWEAYKCFIRGVLIQQGAKLMKERTKQKKQLLLQIQKLESHHKLTRASQTLSELTKARLELRQLIQKETDRATFLLRKMYYDHQNKCGKLLARVLKRKSHIFKMRDSKGQIRTSPKDIHKVLTDFYETLYQIQNINTKAPSTQQYDKYLSSSGMRKGEIAWLTDLVS
ncbi:hypothetical protein XELAEV_18014814mg [Xenopus laevis]|uniref:Endonuclease/exonuclease/phosphatase domain-containing protein n=1 Tax=Xenopus laevis TaxID=8355 RepID=A0A974DGU5_XENLA|nr:hypothetical protein XELAEV_18014814mg [Xenopus laevis]